MENRATRTVFLHCLDYHHYDIARNKNKYNIEDIIKETKGIFRSAFLISDHVMLSASAYFENQVCRKIIDDHPLLCEMGYVSITAKEPYLGEHLDKKREQHYDANSPEELFSSYRKTPNSRIVYHVNPILLSENIKSVWKEKLASGNLAKWIFEGKSADFSSQLETNWEKTPELIEGRAFIPQHVVSIFEDMKWGAVPLEKLQELVDIGYIKAHSLSKSVLIFKNTGLLQAPWSEPKGIQLIDYVNFKREVNCHNISKLLGDLPESVLVRAKHLGVFDIEENCVGQSVKIRINTKATMEIKKVIELENYRKEKDRSLAVGIVTVLPEEWLAVKSCFQAVPLEAPQGDPNSYAIAELTNEKNGAVLTVIITFAPRMGTNSAAVVSANMLRSFPKMQEIIFCGIACSCPKVEKPEEGPRLGDILVSDKTGLIQLDIQAVVDGVSKNRSAMPIPSRKILDAHKNLLTDSLSEVFSWDSIIEGLGKENKKFARPEEGTDILLNAAGGEIPLPDDGHGYRRRRANVFSGPIGSGNSLYRDWKKRDEEQSRHGLIGIEMEGAGTAEAVWHFGKSYTIVRGVCDYGDNRTKNDTWHFYAAGTAAAYTYSLLEKVVNP